MKIGIVGAGENMWPEDKIKHVRLIISRLLDTRKSDWEDLDLGFRIDEFVFVTGRFPEGGVGVWMEEMADAKGLKKEIYSPDVKQLEDHLSGPSEGSSDLAARKEGYDSCCKQIAKAVDYLWVISPQCPNCHGEGRYPTLIRDKNANGTPVDPSSVVICQECDGVGRRWNLGELIGDKAERLGKVVRRLPF